MIFKDNKFSSFQKNVCIKGHWSCFIVFTSILFPPFKQLLIAQKINEILCDYRLMYKINSCTFNFYILFHSFWTPHFLLFVLCMVCVKFGFPMYATLLHFVFNRVQSTMRRIYKILKTIKLGTRKIKYVYYLLCIQT